MPIYKMKGKKEGKQRYRVRVNFTDNEGKARQIDRVAYGLEDAKTLERELAQSKTEQLITRLPTINQLFNEYMLSREKSIRETSYAQSKRMLELHILPILGRYRVDKLTMPTLQRWKNDLNTAELALISKQKIYGELRGLLNYAVRMDYITANPLIRLGNFKDAMQITTEHNVDYYTADEFKKFITTAKEQAIAAEKNGDLLAWHYYVFFAIAFYTGLRKGEIHGLRWNAIDGDYLSVKCSVAQKLKGNDRITPPKNRSSLRTLQMPKPLIDILQQHKERCQQYPDFSEDKFICGYSKPLRDSTVEYRNQKYAQLAGVKKIRIHDFRHSHASLLANEGINIQEVARRLCHADIKMTWNRYAHLYPREEERAIAILNKIV